MATGIDFGIAQYFDFDPTTFPNCSLWLDGADGNVLFSDTAGTTLATPGGLVARWGDKSSNANALVQSTSLNRPTYTASGQNGRSVVTFTQANLTVLVSGTLTNPPSGTAGYSAFVIARTTLSNATQEFFTFGNGGVGSNYFRLRTASNVTPILIQDYSNAGISSNSTAILNNTFIFSASSTTAAAGPFYNGTAFTTTTNFAYNFGSPTVATIGAVLAGGGSYLEGFVAEIILYNRNITLNERRHVEGYLAWKWGLNANIPRNHPYRTIPPAVRQFQPNDIPNIQLWLDAADASTLTLSGSSVSTWADKSGNALNASGGVSPTYSNNGVNFTGSEYLSTSYSAVPTAETICVVATITGTTTPKNYFMIGNTGATGLRGYQVNFTSPNYTINWDRSGVARYAATGGVQSNVRFLTTGLFGGTSGSTGLNGGTQTTASFSFAGTGTTVIGAISSAVSGTSWVGTINEIIIYTRSITTVERQQVEGYLARKWGRHPNLAAGHPYLKPFPSTPLFSPVQISNCVFWIDAQDPSTITSNANSIVQTVVDKSQVSRTITNGYTDVQTTGFVWNGATKFNTIYPSFFYNDTQNRTLGSNNTISLTQPVTVFTVMQRVGTGAAQDVFDGGSTATATQRLFGFYFGGSDNYRIFAGSTLAQTGTMNANGGVYSHVFSNTTSAIFENGTSIASGTAGTNTGNGITIGSRQTQNTETWQGHICEVIYYSRLLTTEERQTLEGYLAWKWGTQTRLPSTHRYYKFRP